jgi:uncharacterized membrane protein YeaQ/YmgE (transglycosylase-associated protein family)
MDISLSEFVAWLIVGALAGTATGFLVKRKKEGFGRWTNVGIGLVGALIGGLLLNVLEFVLGRKLDLGEITIGLQEVVAAFVGSLLFLIGLGIYRWRRKKRLPPQ